MSSIITTRPRGASRRAPIACTTAGCTLLGQQACHDAEAPHHIAEVRNLDTHSLAVIKEGTEKWRVGAYIEDAGTNLTLEEMTALAADLTEMTALASRLNAAAALATNADS